MRVYLRCRYRDKEEVKKMGARWDHERRSWFVDNPENIEDFAKWVITKEPAIATRRPRSNKSRSFGTTGSIGASCGCNALPWDECEHTVADVDALIQLAKHC